MDILIQVFPSNTAEEIIITLLILEWIIVFLILEVGMTFLIRKRSDRLKVSEYQERAFAGACFGFSLLWIFIIISDYYVTDEIITRILLTISEICMNLGVLSYIFNMEKIKLFLYQKFFLTKTYMAFIISYIYVAIFFNDFASFYMSVNVIYFFGFIYYYISLFHKMLLKKRALQKFKISMLFLIIGVLILLIGFLFTVVEVRTLLGWGLIFRFIGDIIQLIAIVILVVFILLVPTSSEFDWEGKIEAIILMLKNGLPIYSQSLVTNNDSENNLQVSGTITTIKMMLDATLENKGVSIIEKKGKTMIIVAGTKLYGIIVCTEDLLSLQILLKSLIEKVENLYGMILNDTFSNLKIFKPIENIVKDLFF